MIIQLSKYPVYIGNDSLEALSSFISLKKYDSVFVLTDTSTKKHCYPVLKNYLPEHTCINISYGEKNKNIKSCEYIWEQLVVHHATRNSILINAGGGMIGDIGGFAAGLYMRGIDFVQVPTTLLAQADASVGGKTGIDFKNIKNIIGLFNDPQAVFIDTRFLKTLPERELRSGFAEVIKHHLIADKSGFEKLSLSDKLPLRWEEIIIHSIRIKSEIAENDPYEKGNRKSLNFGHTLGHGIESCFLNEDEIALLHGEAVAAGMICELFISKEKNSLGEGLLNKALSYIRLFYTLPYINEEHAEKIYGYILNDKKNKHNKILCTLLNDIGSYNIDREIDRQDIFNSIQQYNLLLHAE